MRRIKLIEEHFTSSPIERQPSLGLVNQNLSVAAIGFRAHNDQLIGMVLTPRFLDLFLLPEDNEGWKDGQVGESHVESFPAGNIKFVHDWETRIGAYAYCTLLASVLQFDDQHEAESVALAALKRLHLEDAEDLPNFPGMSREMIVQAVKSSRKHEPDPRSASTRESPIAQAEKKQRPDEDIDESRRGLFTRFLG